MTIQNSLYQYFGTRTGGSDYSCAVLSDRPHGFSPNTDLLCGHWGTLCLTIVSLIYFLRIEPVNVVLEQATARSMLVGNS